MNILILSASRKVSLIQEFQRVLAEEGGGKVIAGDMSPFSPALYFADESLLLPSSHHKGFLPTLFTTCRRRKIKLVIPTRDEELPILSKAKGRLGKLGTTVYVASARTIQKCQDKWQFNHFCETHGFAIPKWYTNEDRWEKVRFPVFVKPRVGKGGDHAQRVDSKRELTAILKSKPDAIIQECVNAPEFTVDLFSDFAGRVLSVIPRKRIKVWGGESFVSETCNDSLIVQSATQLAKALKLVGPNTIQCFLDHGVVKFIEVNPRFGGGANLGFSASARGGSIPALMVRSVLGKKVSSRIGDFKPQCFMLRYTNDLILDQESLCQTVNI